MSRLDQARIHTNKRQSMSDATRSPIGRNRRCSYDRSRYRTKPQRRSQVRAAGRRQTARKPLYNTWKGMVQRCTNPNNPDYPRYGGRGIGVSAEWRDSYEAFARDVGPKPNKNLSLDRIDNNGHYEPGNVRWATAKAQANNRSQRSNTSRLSRS